MSPRAEDLALYVLDGMVWYSIVVLFIYEHFVDIGVFLLVVGMWSYSV